MSRYARHVDTIHGPVVAALRASGCTVEPIQGARAGVPDLLVGWGGVTDLVEVKSGNKAAHALTEAQEAWHRTWRGRPVVVVRSVEDALALVARLRGEATRAGKTSDAEVDPSDYERQGRNV